MTNPTTPTKKEQLRHELDRARHELATLLASLQPDQWQLPVYGEGENWTVHNVVSHLVDGEFGMTVQIERIRRGEPTVPEDFDLDRWNKRAVAKMAEKKPEELRQALDNNRSRLLKALETVEENEWGLKGRHSSLRVLSIEQYFYLIASHEARHTADIARMVGR
jgi:uncharacterized protein (TIGR03083 family)